MKARAKTTPAVSYSRAVRLAERRLEAVADIIQKEIVPFNGWWIDDAVAHYACEKAAQKILWLSKRWGKS